MSSLKISFLSGSGSTYEESDQGARSSYAYGVFVWLCFLQEVFFALGKSTFDGLLGIFGEKGRGYDVLV